MMNTNQQPRVLTENPLKPLQKLCVKVISVGLLTRAISRWCGAVPMLHSIIRQFLQQVEWGQLDYLSWTCLREPVTL